MRSSAAAVFLIAMNLVHLGTLVTAVCWKLRHARQARQPCASVSRADPSAAGHTVLFGTVETQSRERPAVTVTGREHGTEHVNKNSHSHTWARRSAAASRSSRSRWCSRRACASASRLTRLLGEKLPLLTDDRKERRIARELFPAIEIISTLDVIADAERALRWSTTDLAHVAEDLRWRGNFAPPRNDPRSAWYEGLLHRSG